MDMKEIHILAPLDGKVLPLEEVPDEVFAQKMVGDGVAIQPSGGEVVAPISGELVKLFPGGHAFGIAGSDGIELIVHIGLDTIELQGKGFRKIAKEGQQVTAGMPIVSFDRAILEGEGKITISPVVSSGKGIVRRRAQGQVQAGRDVLFTLEV